MITQAQLYSAAIRAMDRANEARLQILHYDHANSRQRQDLINTLRESELCAQRLLQALERRKSFSIGAIKAKGGSL